MLLEAFGCSRPWLFDPLEVSSIVVVVDVGEKIATMQPVVAMCLGLNERLLLSTGVDEGSSGVLWGTRTWREHAQMMDKTAMVRSKVPRFGSYSMA